ncbi:hypothetical protein JCM21900_002588 [Sporobolomyces salmonicolor]
MDRASPGQPTPTDDSYQTAIDPSSELDLANSLLSLSLSLTQPTPPQPPCPPLPPAPSSEPPKHHSPSPSAPLPQPTASSPPTSSQSSRTFVLLQPACTQHRYVRDHHDLSTIVERPERIRAVKTGVAAAWARLERRGSSGGKRWEKPSGREEGEALGDLMSCLSLGGFPDGDRKGKGGKANEVRGGPFDILVSHAQMSVDAGALRMVHGKPNYAPGEEEVLAARSAEEDPPVVVTSASTSTSTPSQQQRARSTRSPSPSKPSSSTSGCPAPPPPPPPPAWPHQLTSLIRAAPSALSTPPSFSEIPSHLPQGDLYLCEESGEAIFGALGAVCEGVDRVVAGSGSKGVNDTGETEEGGSRGGEEERYARGFVAIRPPGHHCGESSPQGFCFVNNVCVAAAHAHLKHGINRVIILDIDLHHGNGTQDIVWRLNAEAHRLLSAHEAAHSKSSSPRKGLSKKQQPGKEDEERPRPLQIMYGSLHDIWSYPCESADPALVAAASLALSGGHGQFISNVHLESYDGEEDFYERVYGGYKDGLLGRAKQFVRKTGAGPAETLVMVSAGFDASPYELPSMSRHAHHVPTSFYRRFLRDACAFAASHSEGKVLCVLEGGYSDRALASGAAGLMEGLVGAAVEEEEEEEGRGDPHEKEEQVEEGRWDEGEMKKLEKACSVVKKPKRGPGFVTRGNFSGGGGAGLAAPTLVGAGPDSTAEPWLARAVEVFSWIEDGEVRPGLGLAPPTTTRAKEQPRLAPRQLRERKARVDYAELAENGLALGGTGAGSGTGTGTPTPSPGRGRGAAAAAEGAGAGRRTVLASADASANQDRTLPAARVVPAAAPTSTATSSSAGRDKPAVKFVWKQGGFGGGGGEPRI